MGLEWDGGMGLNFRWDWNGIRLECYWNGIGFEIGLRLEWDWNGKQGS